MGRWRRPMAPREDLGRVSVLGSSAPNWAEVFYRSSRLRYQCRSGLNPVLSADLAWALFDLLREEASGLDEVFEGDLIVRRLAVAGGRLGHHPLGQFTKRVRRKSRHHRHSNRLLRTQMR